METPFQTAKLSKRPIIFLKKRIETFDFKVYTLFLFKIDPIVAKEEIIQYCRSYNADKLSNTTLYAFIFFDNEKYADFPKRAATYIYNTLEDSLAVQHIKAVYISNVINGFSKLFYYPTSYFFGHAEEHYYLDGLTKNIK